MQFAAHDKWAAKGLLALLGVGVEPGLSNVFAKYAEHHLFRELDDVAPHDGSNLEVVDAQAMLAMARSTRIDALASYQMALINYQLSIGEMDYAAP